MTPNEERLAVYRDRRHRAREMVATARNTRNVSVLRRLIAAKRKAMTS